MRAGSYAGPVFVSSCRRRQPTLRPRRNAHLQTGWRESPGPAGKTKIRKAGLHWITILIVSTALFVAAFATGGAEMPHSAGSRTGPVWSCFIRPLFCLSRLTD